MGTYRVGILDPDAINENPLTGEPYSEDYVKLSKVWRTYPVYQRADEIIDEIKRNQILLIVAEMGSGKTVLVPKFALHALEYKGKIAVTLPKQLTTLSAAEFSASVSDVKVGQEIGYQYKGSPKTAKGPNTKLLYATDGTIKARLLKDPSLKEFDIVIIDEAHERKVQIDFLLYLLRETLKLRPEFKIIIMSATINIQIFRDYFFGYKFNNIDLAGARTFPIESIFLKDKLGYNETLQKGFEILIDVLGNDDLKAEGMHDVIFFVVSSNDAMTMCEKLDEYIRKNEKKKCKITCDGDVFCVEVYSGMDAKKQLLAQDKDLYKKGTKYTRKVVMATNVAESSLTISGIGFVIDSGYELKSSYDPVLRAKKLDRQLITQAQARQRMGRTGRVGPGICYHLYTKKEFDDMEAFPLPDIRISDITDDCLSLLTVVGNVDKLVWTLTQFIEPPKENYIKSAINVLTRLGMVETEITPLGRLLAEFPTENVISGLVLIYGKMYNCIRELLKIYSITETCKNNINKLFNPHVKQNRKKYYHEYGDHLSLLKLFNLYKQAKQSNETHSWTKNNGLNLDVLIKSDNNYKRAKQLVQNITVDPSLNNIKYFEPITKYDPTDRIMVALFLGYRINAATKSQTNSYTTLQGDLKTNISRSSFLHFGDLPKTVIYNELFISMGKNDLNIVSRVPAFINKIYNDIL